MKIHTIATILGLAAAASAEVFLHETFSDGAAWEERWTPSKHKDDLGVMKLSPGKFYADENKSAGLQTSEDYRFYAISAPVTPFSNKDKDLVVQYTVKNEQNIDCGGGYLKVSDMVLIEKRDIQVLNIIFSTAIQGIGPSQLHR
jgi:calreticulin